MKITSAAVLVLILTANATSAETVDVKGHGPVNLTSFECDDDTRSSEIMRICYDAERRHLLLNIPQISVNDENSDAGLRTYLLFCDVDPNTVAGRKAAPSLSIYYRTKILGKGYGLDGPFDCGTQRPSKP